MGGDAPTLTAKDKTQVSCRICGGLFRHQTLLHIYVVLIFYFFVPGDHWTTHCQFQGASEAEKELLRKKFAGSESAEGKV
jgi:hypothetical protein